MNRDVCASWIANGDRKFFSVFLAVEDFIINIQPGTHQSKEKDNVVSFQTLTVRANQILVIHGLLRHHGITQPDGKRIHYFLHSGSTCPTNSTHFGWDTNNPTEKSEDMTLITAVRGCDEVGGIGPDEGMAPESEQFAVHDGDADVIVIKDDEDFSAQERVENIANEFVKRQGKDKVPKLYSWTEKENIVVSLFL